MNTNVTILIVGVVVGLGISFFLIPAESDETPIDENLEELSEEVQAEEADFEIYPISHASFVLKLGTFTIANDPVGDVELFIKHGQPNVILISDIHSDHLNVATLEALMSERTELIAPQAVIDELPAALAGRAVPLENGGQYIIRNLSIEAIPMYNLPVDGPDYWHAKGRGNGYVLQVADTRIYIAGDTDDIPEMRSLEGIDYAFIPMNPPYTMNVEAAAAAVSAFSPRVVYPYHYLGTEGLSDVGHFVRLVNNLNPDIDVQLLDWYPK